jgi:hypothetical protein
MIHAIGPLLVGSLYEEPDPPDFDVVIGGLGPTAPLTCAAGCLFRF